MKEKEEKCVICGENAGYMFDTPIYERQFYVEGVGQLCEKCFKEIYTQEKLNEGSIG